jgi:hypothetical protein
MRVESTVRVRALAGCTKKRLAGGIWAKEKAPNPKALSIKGQCPLIIRFKTAFAVLPFQNAVLTDGGREKLLRHRL